MDLSLTNRHRRDRRFIDEDTHYAYLLQPIARPNSGVTVLKHQEQSMRALSVVRPSGSRIASGEKTLEVRRWQPKLAALEDLLIVENGRFLHQEGDKDDEGIAVAIVKVRVVRPFTMSDMEAACASYFEEGWLAWELIDIRPVQSTERVLAARGIYDVNFMANDRF